MFSIIKDALNIFSQTTSLYERSMLVKEKLSSKSVSETTRPIFHKSKSCRQDQTNAGQCAFFNGVCPPNFNCTGTTPDDICCGIDPLILAKKFIGNMQKFSSKHTKSDLCEERRFVLASQIYNWDCYIFHDIDSLPEDLRNVYNCSDKNPRHLGIHISKFNYTLLYNDFLGGATAFTYDQFKNVNGFPNDYWGWGGEDDDMALRISYAGYKIERVQSMYGNYTTIPHKQDQSNPANDCRWIMLKFTKNRWRKDGLSNLIFQIELAEQRKLYTRFLIDLNEEESRQWFKSQIISKACDLMRALNVLAKM
uniref:Beta-1,4-N-acetylgalactosaminyltransferase n=1 Tax=Acrobeloides nanus TaxID=290746 RepID=A0A914ER50_9BILA